MESSPGEAISEMRLGGKNRNIQQGEEAWPFQTGQPQIGRSRAVRTFLVFQELQVVSCSMRRCAERKVLEGKAREVCKGQLLQGSEAEM